MTKQEDGDVQRERLKMEEVQKQWPWLKSQVQSQRRGEEKEVIMMWGNREVLKNQDQKKII